MQATATSADGRCCRQWAVGLLKVGQGFQTPVLGIHIDNHHGRLLASGNADGCQPLGFIPPAADAFMIGCGVVDAAERERMSCW